MCRFLLGLIIISVLIYPTLAGTWELIVRRASQYEPYIIDAGRREGIDPRLLWAVAYNETKFNPALRSPVGALGMMQFMPATAARFGLGNPFNPIDSIYAAARYFSYLQKLFPGRPDLQLAAYNAGEVAVQSYLTGHSVTLNNGKVINALGRKTNGVPPYRETMNYVLTGMTIFNHLQVDNEANVLVKNRAQLPADEKLPEVVEARIAKPVRASIYLYGDSAFSELDKTENGNVNDGKDSSKITPKDESKPAKPHKNTSIILYQ